MPVNNPADVLYRYQNQALGALPANATETALTSTPVLQAALPGAFGQAGPAPQPVKISGVLNVLAGAGVTALVLRIRQGVGTGGAVVGAAQTLTLAAAASGSFAFSVEDTTGLIESGTAYTVTLSQTGATGASTINTFDLEVSA
jgi:hypothetical protein